MGQVNAFKGVKLFCGLIFRQDDDAKKAIQSLGAEFSAMDFRSAPIPFTMTDYYREEMGSPLFRQFVSFREWIPPERLPAIKRFTNELELRLSRQGKRSVNVDPGYISDANVVIATSKNHYHRVPLQEGIYAHLEYVLKNNRISFLPWTYPDFQSEPYLAFFRELFALFKRQRKANTE